MAISHSHLGHGIGLRSEFAAQLDVPGRRCDWLEAISENYMGQSGPAVVQLSRLRRDYPIVLHGVGLGIGNSDPLSDTYLNDLTALIARVEPIWVSDHLVWTAHDGVQSHELLPLPYTEECLAHVVRRVGEVQERLGRQLVLENASTYAQFAGNCMPEWAFLAAVANAADCGLLLDLNNVYVNATNHGFDPYTYVDALPWHRVVQIHLAGHANMGTHLLDTHGAPVAAAVWDLYRHVVARYRPVATLIEWDEDIPPLERVLKEMHRAQAIERDLAPPPPGATPNDIALGRNAVATGCPA